MHLYQNKSQGVAVADDILYYESRISIMFL